MNHLDSQSMMLLNGLIGRSQILFETALLLCGSLPLVVCVMAWLALWWTRSENLRPLTLPVQGTRVVLHPESSVGRRRCVALGAGASMAFLLTRVLAAGIQRPRPLAGETLQVPLDPGVWRDMVSAMTGFGAFPSDHAALFFAMAVGLFAWGQKLGLAGVVTAILLCTARVAVGFHYPSDMVAGALLGGGSAWIFMRMARSSPGFFDAVVDLFRQYPAVLYPCLFLVCLDFTQHFRLLMRLAFFVKQALLGSG